MFIMGKVVLTAMSAYIHCQHLIADLTFPEKYVPFLWELCHFLHAAVYSSSSYLLQKKRQREDRGINFQFFCGDGRLKEQL